MNDIYFSIVIPTFHDWERLGYCIAALDRQTYSKERFEVIVVNNDPSDSKPKDLIFPGYVKIIEEPEPGSYAARNAGLNVAKGSIIGFTDSDCIPEADWIQNAYIYFKANKNILRIGGQIKLFYKGDKPNLIELYDTVFAFRQSHYVRDQGFGVTGNMFASKKLFESVGQFNSSLMSGGDFEWGQRASFSGHSICYAENVIVRHPARAYYSELKRKVKRVSGGHFLMSSKKHTAMELVFRLLRNLKPKKDDIRAIIACSTLSRTQRIMVFILKYHLNFLTGFEKLKIHFGAQPERL